jgi:hypothetical protein
MDVVVFFDEVIYNFINLFSFKATTTRLFSKGMILKAVLLVTFPFGRVDLIPP